MSARDFFPARMTWRACREASLRCQGCDLWKNGTQTVFGEGPMGADLFFVGEQPGLEEDKAGRPFVGPAGRVLDEAMAAAGLDRDKAYVTNVVKHFKWEPRGKRKLHKKPGGREIAACLPWLEKEIEFVRPKVVVALGATAAQALLGKDFRVSLQRGEIRATRFCPLTTATVHPSSILRQPTSEDRRREMERLIDDLSKVASVLKTRRSA